jgi:PAS domain S-box-containing protein
MPEGWNSAMSSVAHEDQGGQTLEAPTSAARWHLPTLSPSMLAYLIGPIAFVLILFLMKFNVVAHESLWLWLGVFIASPAVSFVCNRLYLVDPTPRRLHLRIGASAASVTMVTYLTGWGPALVLAFAFLVLENIALDGSRVWRTTASWSVVGIAAGQFAIWRHWAPSFLSPSRANALALMGAVVLLFVIRMAGMVMEQKEKAETSMRLSEDRFRSLIQNSSDITIVVDGEGCLSYVSPVVTQLLGFEPGELVGQRATEIVHADDHEYVRSRFAAVPKAGVEPSFLQQFRMKKLDGSYCNVEAVITDQRDRPSIGGYVANVRDITERKEFEALLAPSRCCCGPGATRVRWRCASSTWTTSRTPMTRSATRPGTSSCAQWQSASRACCAAATPWGASGATSS